MSTTRVPYGDVRERPGPSRRDRSPIAVAAPMAVGRSDQLTGHLGRALGNGVTTAEIGEPLTRLAPCPGWPTAMTTGRIAAEVFGETKS